MGGETQERAEARTFWSDFLALFGRALMNAAKQWAQDHGAAYVALASRRAGAVALALGYAGSATFYKKTLGAETTAGAARD
jgi:GNAT superfamily N-acetyltransferase